MAEDIATTTETAAPTTETAGEEKGIGTSPSTPSDRGALRDAALAALGDVTEETSEAETTEEGETPPAVVAKAEEKPPAPAKEQLSPQLRAAAAQEKRNRELANEAKADKAAAESMRAAIAEERRAWEAEKAKPAAESVDFASDPVAYADARKLTPAQRQQMATDLWYSAQPEDKRPQGYRQNTKVMSEVEVLRAETKELAKKLADREEAETRKEQEARELQEQGELATAMLTEAKATETAPFVTALLEHNPKVVQADLKMLAKRLISEAADPETVTSESVVAEYERLLAKQSAWIHKALQTKQAKDGTSAPPKGPKAATALTNQGTASPTREQGPVSRDARRAAALASIED